MVAYPNFPRLLALLCWAALGQLQAACFPSVVVVEALY